jgi:tRNA (adenine22-N1)-methyltransferase
MTHGINSVVDIGCDHGKLALNLAKRGVKVIATDISEPSLQKARELAAKHDVLIDTRMGDGLQVVKPNEAECIIMAGMGQNTIINILKKGKAVVDNAKYIICQSMNGDYDLRSFLSDNGFAIDDESLAIEGHRLYCIIKAIPNKKSELSELQRYIGTKLILNKDKYFNRYLENNISIMEDIIKGLKGAKSTDNQKIIYLSNILSQMKEIKNAQSS